MPDLPQLAPVNRCPDCEAGLGEKHAFDCLIALCVMTGEQRILHSRDQADFTAACYDLPVDVHTCGEQVWTGYPPGSVEAAAHGLYVRPARSDDAPFTGWIPCTADEPGAVPDLDRVVRTGTWDPIRQVFRIPEQVSGRV